MEHEHAGSLGYLKTVAETILTGLVFGLLVSVAFTLLAALPSPLRPLIHAVEQTGVEVGMLIYSHLFDERRESRVGGRKEPGYTFIDIDPRACAKFFASDASVCQGVNPARPDLVVALAREIARAGPRVIVVDADPFSAGNEAAQAQSPPREQTGAPTVLPPIVYATGYRASSGALVGTLRQTARGGEVFAPVPALPGVPVTIRRLDDPDLKVRRYPPVVVVQPAEGRPHLLPTLPFAAAAIAAAPSSQAGFEEIHCAFSAGPDSKCEQTTLRDELGAKIRTSARRPGAGQCCRPGVRLALLLFGSLAGAGAAAQSGRRAEQGRRSLFSRLRIRAVAERRTLRGFRAWARARPCRRHRIQCGKRARLACNAARLHERRRNHHQCHPRLYQFRADRRAFVPGQAHS